MVHLQLGDQLLVLLRRDRPHHPVSLRRNALAGDVYPDHYVWEKDRELMAIRESFPDLAHLELLDLRDVAGRAHLVDGEQLLLPGKHLRYEM